MIEDYDNEDYDYFKEWDIEQYKKEIERLHSIIKEAREYIKLVATDHDIMNNNEIIYTQMQYEEIENLLEILDKENI